MAMQMGNIELEHDLGQGTQYTDRIDLYAAVHKGLRGLLCDVLIALGRMDEMDDHEVADVLARMRGALELCKLHLQKENLFIHPVMESRQPGSSAQPAQEHASQEHEFLGLEEAVGALENSPVPVRRRAAAQLYRRF
jgi:hemerythrin-like domain-containing protein